MIKATSAYLLNNYNTQFDANPKKKKKKKKEKMLKFNSCKGSEKDIKNCNHWGFGHFNGCGHLFDELVRCSACKYVRATLYEKVQVGKDFD